MPTPGATTPRLRDDSVAARSPGLAVFGQDLCRLDRGAVCRAGRQSVATVLGNGHGLHRLATTARPHPCQGRVPRARHLAGRRGHLGDAAESGGNALAAERGDGAVALGMPVPGAAQSRPARLCVSAGRLHHRVHRVSCGHLAGKHLRHRRGPQRRNHPGHGDGGALRVAAVPGLGQADAHRADR